MLTDAVLEAGGVGRFLKPRAAGRTLAGLARHPRRAVRDSAGFGAELARVAAGRSTARPAKGDRRFGDYRAVASALARPELSPATTR